MSRFAPLPRLASFFILPLLPLFLFTACETIYEGSDEQKRDEGMLPPLPRSIPNTTIYFKNGATITGWLISLIPDSAVTVQRADGKMSTYSIAEVGRIEAGQRQVPTSVSPDSTAVLPKSPTTLEPPELPVVFEAEAIAGYAFTDGYNTGLGLRVGIVPPSGVYLGGVVIYHLGILVKNSDRDFLYETRGSVLQLGVELGATVPLGRFFYLRPYLSGGVGNYIVSVTATNRVGSARGSASLEQPQFYISPGVEVKARFEKLTLGIDARTLVAPNLEGSGMFGIYFTTGFRL